MTSGRQNKSVYPMLHLHQRSSKCNRSSHLTFLLLARLPFRKEKVEVYEDIENTAAKHWQNRWFGNVSHTGVS